MKKRREIFLTFLIRELIASENVIAKRNGRKSFLPFPLWAFRITNPYDSTNQQYWNEFYANVCEKIY